MKNKTRILDARQAINEALKEEMRRDESVFILGEDIAVYNGTFLCTEGLLEEFGPERVRDTPISESAIVGGATGAASMGMRPIAEIQFADFIGVCLDQIMNHLAQLRYVYGGKMKLPVVIRLPVGGRYPFVAAGAQHCQSLEAMPMHIPGLKVVSPSTPYDFKGLLKTAIRDDNPVMFFEHKLLYLGNRNPKVAELYPTVIEFVPEEEYTIPFGLASVKREGTDATIVATTLGVHKALKAAKELEKQRISVEIIDPRTLVPLDKKTIIDSVKKTRRALVVTEDCRTCGVSAELAAIIAEEAFGHLESPVKRLTGLDTPIPYSLVLEKATIPQPEDIVQAVKILVGKGN